MTGLGSVVVGGIGLQMEEQETVVVFNRCGATRVALGQVVAFDLPFNDPAVNDNDANSDDSGFANVVQPPSTVNITVGQGIYGVVTDLMNGEGADNTKVLVCVRGRVQAKASAALTAGSVYGVSGVANDRQLLATGAAAHFKKVAIALETGAGAGNHDVLFNGVEGFGTGAGS